MGSIEIFVAQLVKDEGRCIDVGCSDILNQGFGIIVPALNIILFSGGVVACCIYCKQ